MLKFTDLSGMKVVATTMKANSNTAIKIMATVENRALGVPRYGLLSMITVVSAGTPHAWQNIAFSSNLVPHLRQKGIT